MFKDREEAGQKLLPPLEDFEDDANAVVAGLPRGGVIVAKEVAKGLNLPLEAIVSKKLGAPGNPELAIGAVAEGERMLDEKIIKEYRITNDHIESETVKVGQEIERRVKLYRHGKPLLDLVGKSVIIVDDGIATGATMLVAIRFAKSAGAREIVVAVPVASEEVIPKIEKEADKTICLEKVGPYFFAVGEHFEHFLQVSDEEVIKALKSAHIKS